MLLNNTPLFSVVVASYNNSQYLNEMIESVIQQSWSNWELVIAEDCSTDGSLEVLKKWTNHDRVNLIVHEKNKGAGGAFATATEAARGVFIGMLGADDALHPDALKIMAEAHLNHPNASLITSLAMGCNAKLKPLGAYLHCRNLEATEELIHHPVVGNFATFKSIAYQKTDGFNADLRKAVDRDVFLKLDEVGELKGVNKHLYYYRLHDGGISQGESGMKANQYAIQATLAAYRRRKGTHKANLGAKQYRTLLRTWYFRECHPLRWVHRKKCNELLKRALLEVPSILLTRTFWSIAARNNFLKP